MKDLKDNYFCICVSSEILYMDISLTLKPNLNQLISDFLFFFFY